MRSLTSLLRVGAVLALTTLATHAQSTKTVTVTFQTVGIGSAVGNVYYKNGSTYVALKSQINRVSTSTVSYAGPAEMVIYRQQRGAAPAPAPSTASGTAAAAPAVSGPDSNYVAAGKATFAGNGNYRLYLTPGPNNSVMGVPVPNSSSNFPGGSFMFVNASGVPLEVRFEDENDAVKKTAPLAVGQSVMMPMPPSTIVHFMRTDKKPADDVNHFLADTNKIARTTMIILPDFSTPTLTEDGSATAAPTTGAASGGGSNRGPGGSNRPRSSYGGGG